MRKSERSLDDVVVSTCQTAPSFYFDTCHPGAYAANLIATISPSATESRGLDAIDGVAADGIVVGSKGAENIEQLPDRTQRIIPSADGLLGVVSADEVIVETSHGDSIWQGSCGLTTAVSSLFPASPSWAGVEISGWNADGDLIGTGLLDGASHGFLRRPVLASCAAPTVTKLAPSSVLRRVASR